MKNFGLIFVCGLTMAASSLWGADAVLEQGKVLYANGQYKEALGKFMKVLRRDPQDPEARQYLRLVVDQIRQNGSSSAPAPQGTNLEGTPVPYTLSIPQQPVVLSDAEVRARVRQRQLLSFDLEAIPGVRILGDGKKAQVAIDSSLLFTDKTGGLREEGIPILDRVAAWLKTFGQQPIVIHCYPEEVQDANLNGSLFLHRYAQLYGFFVDERKLSATRFINTGLNKPADKNEVAAPSPADADMDMALSTGTPRVVVVSLGGGAVPEEDPNMGATRWLEFGILSSHSFFNPEDGDWTSMDISALARKGVKTWSFSIFPAPPMGMPAGKSTAVPLLSLEGKGNVLRRVSWDGRNPKTGGLAAAGDYICKLTATDVDGSSKTDQISLKVQRKVAEPAVAEKSKAVKKTASKPKSKSKPKPKLDVAPISTASVPKPAVPEPTPVAQAPASASESSDIEGSAHAIWKQVIQFDANESDLKPTLKASLERIGKTMEVYPLQKVRIMGFADSSENNAAGLAKQRADLVRQTLINEYQVDARRVIAAGGKVGSASKVEISITN
jgi:outer membrane protein OmpA-like peptidoglycan-associated protein